MQSADNPVRRRLDEHKAALATLIYRRIKVDQGATT
jgi:hypothetical protein